MNILQYYPTPVLPSCGWKRNIGKEKEGIERRTNIKILEYA
jgi:hypothetical protein